MNTFIERQVIGLLNEIDALNALQKTTNGPDKDELRDQLLDQIDNILTSKSLVYCEDFALETLIRIPEAALSSARKARMVEKYLRSFFRNVASEGLYNIKAHVLYAQLLAQRAEVIGGGSEAKFALVRDAIQHINCAIAIITHEKSRRKYAFMVYNISKFLYQMIRVYFRAGHLREFAEVVQLVSQTLAAQVTDEYEWKGFFSWLLFYCLDDTRTGKQEAIQILEKLWESSRQNAYFFHDALFRLRVFNSATSANIWQTISKEADKDPSGELRIVFGLQSVNTRIIPEAQVEKELTALMRLALPSKSEDLLKPIANSMIELLAEIAHTAAVSGILSVAEKIVEFLKKKQQLPSKAYVLIEFAKAELLIRSKTDPASQGPEQPQSLQREIDIERRREALHVINKAIKVRMGFINPMFVYEGCVKIWNVALPFLNERQKNEVLKPFTTATRVLEEIQSSDFHLRIRLHYEVAKTHFETGNITLSEEHAKKCQRLLNFCEGAFDARKIDALVDKVNAVLRPNDAEARSPLNVLAERVRAAKDLQDEELGKVLGILQRDLSELNLDNLEIFEDAVANLIEIPESDGLNAEAQAAAQKSIAKAWFYKLTVRKCNVYEEVVRLAFERSHLDHCINLANDFIFLITNFAKNAKQTTQTPTQPPAVDAIPQSLLNSVNPDLYFDIEVDQDIQINLVKVLFLKAQALIKRMTDEGVEFAMQDLVLTNASLPPLKHTTAQYDHMKNEIVASFTKGAEVALKLQQTWLIFNAGIAIWNAYLPVFKSATSSPNLHKGTIPLLESYFEALKQAVQMIDKRKIIDYDIENKIQVYGNISIIYTRLLEQAGDYARVYSVTEDLLLVSLTPQTRKIVNSIRARVGLMLKPEAKGGKRQTTSLANATDQTVFEINSRLEVIANHFNGNVKQDDRLAAIRDCFDLLRTFHQKQKDQLDAELLSELWTKLANLAINEEKPACTRLALSALEFSLEKSSRPTPAAPSHSRYTALAKFLYARALCHLVETDGVERGTHEMILLKSLQMILESIDLCIKSKNPKFYEQVKSFYLVIRKIVEQFYTPENRRCIIQPIFSLTYYIKIAKDTFENFMKETELSCLLVNLCVYLTRGCRDREDWELAFMNCNLLLETCQPAFRDKVWILKVIAMTRKGVEIEKVFEEVKDWGVGLQCTLLQEIAWNSDSISVQYLAFTKAIDLVKKDSSSKIFEVVLNFKEWMFRNDFPIDNIKKSLSFLERLIQKKGVFQDSQESVAESQNEDQNLGKAETGELVEVQSMKAIGDAPLNEVCEYFSGGQSTFEMTIKRYASVSYSIEDCDNLFKVYYISSIIVQNLTEQMSFMSNCLFFVWKTWYLIFEQQLLHRIKETGREEPTAAELTAEVIANMPKTTSEWLELKLPVQVQETGNRGNSKPQFTKDTYKQPLITFNYLTLIAESASEYCNFAQSAMLFRFIELFALRIMENQIAAQLPVLWCARIAQQLKDETKSQTLVSEFLKAVPLTQAYFTRETQDFARSYSDAFSKNFELNSISSKVKKTHFLNVYYTFEFWIMFGEACYNLSQFALAKVLFENAMPCCVRASAGELLGKCQTFLARIYSLQGESKQAVSLIESAAKNVKLLRNWRRFFIFSTDHFVENGDFVNSWKMIDKFEYLLKQLSAKDNFQYNKLHGRDVTGMLQLLKIKLHIEEFFRFDEHMMVEPDTYYGDNIGRMLNEVMGLFSSFLESLEENVSLANFELLISVLRTVLRLTDGAKVLNYEVINSLYIFLVLLLKFFERFIGAFNGVRQFLTDSAYQTQSDSGQKSDCRNVMLIAAADYPSAKLLVECELLRVQFINAMLGIEEIYRQHGYMFPGVNEKIAEEKLFKIIKKLKIVDDFNRNSKSLIEDYVGICEYKLNQNLRRSWALLHWSINILRLFLNTPECFDIGDRHIVQLEMDRAKIYLKAYAKELSFAENQLLNKSESGEEQDKAAFGEDLAETAFKETIERVYPPEVLNLTVFGSRNYFRFNQLRCLKTIKYMENITETTLLNDLIEYQDFVTKETMAAFCMRLSHRASPVSRHLSDCLLRSRATDIDKQMTQYPILKSLFTYSPSTESFKTLPKESLYIILQPTQRYTELLCGILFLAEDDTQTVRRFINLKNGNSILSALKSYLRWSETSNIDDETDELKIQEREAIMHEKSNFLAQSFTELISLLIDILRRDNELSAEETAATKGKVTSDKKRPFFGAQKRRFNGLFFLANNDIIECPFELIFERIAQLFAFCSRDLSLSVLVSKMQNMTANKPLPITKADGCYLSYHQMPENTFPEIDRLTVLSKQLFSDGFDCDNTQMPDVSEIQRLFERKRAILFTGCIRFDTLFPCREMLAMVGLSKLELLICFEKVKVVSPAFKKYSARISLSSNYQRLRIFMLQCALLNVRCAVAPTTTNAAQTIESALDGLTKRTEPEFELTDPLLEHTQNGNLIFIGMPKLSISVEQKSKK